MCSLVTLCDRLSLFHSGWFCFTLFDSCLTLLDSCLTLFDSCLTLLDSCLTLFESAWLCLTLFYCLTLHSCFTFFDFPTGRPVDQPTCRPRKKKKESSDCSILEMSLLHRFHNIFFLFLFTTFTHQPTPSSAPACLVSEYPWLLTISDKFYNLVTIILISLTQPVLSQ